MLFSCSMTFKDSIPYRTNNSDSLGEEFQVTFFFVFFEHLCSECLPPLDFFPLPFFFLVLNFIIRIKFFLFSLNTLFTILQQVCMVGLEWERILLSLEWVQFGGEIQNPFSLFMASYKSLRVVTVTTTLSSSYLTFLLPWTIKKKFKTVEECIKLCEQRLNLNDDDVGCRSEILWIFVISSFLSSIFSW